MDRSSTGVYGIRELDFLAAILVIGWYCAVYGMVRPLTEVPVGDSWVYEHAVTHLNATGTIQFPGFTQAMPMAQVLYGAGWSRAFGASSRSFDLSIALVGILGCLLFYGLARKCGAGIWPAAAATALIAGNPCYLFLSFSFMTDVPFLAALLASYLAFAYTTNRSRRAFLWLWIAGAAAAIGFAIRPFAAATIVAEAAVLFLGHDSDNRINWQSRISVLSPLLAALVVCAAFWAWLTILNPKPWMLEYDEHRLRAYFALVPIRMYLAGGLLEPAIYLGIMLSPLALLHFINNWQRSIIIAGVMLASSIIIMWLGDEPIWDLERFNCFGGSAGALVLSGVPPHDFSLGLAWILLLLGAAGFGGICNAWYEIIQARNPVVLVILLATAMYWLAMPLLWLFSDRYNLVLLPAACLPLALRPFARRQTATVVAGLMTATLALVSAGGVASYHRTMQKILIETQALLRQGIPRRQIDAGYSLNGRDLYVYPARGIDTARDEPPIPLIIDSPVLPYIISTSPITNTMIWRRFSGCGPLGFGRRSLFLLKADESLTHNHPKALPNGKLER